MWHSHLNDMEIPETKHFNPKGFELGTTLSYPNCSIDALKCTGHNAKCYQPAKNFLLPRIHT